MTTGVSPDLPAPVTGAEKPPSDTELFRRLVRAIDAGTIELEIDPKRINHVDCPIAGAAIHTQNVYVVTGLCLAIAWFTPPSVALPLLALIIAVNWRFGLPWVYRRMQAHARRLILADSAAWTALWRFGGVTLSRRPPPPAAGDAPPPPESGVRCTGPRGDWRQLVADG